MPVCACANIHSLFYHIVAVANAYNNGACFVLWPNNSAILVLVGSNLSTTRRCHQQNQHTRLPLQRHDTSHTCVATPQLYLLSTHLLSDINGLFHFNNANKYTIAQLCSVSSIVVAILLLIYLSCHYTIFFPLQSQCDDHQSRQIRPGHHMQTRPPYANQATICKPGHYMQIRPPYADQATICRSGHHM